MSSKIADINTIRKIVCILHEYTTHHQRKSKRLVSRKQSETAINGEINTISSSADYDAASIKRIKKIVQTLYSICACCLVDESSLIISLIYLDRFLSSKWRRSFELEIISELFIGCIFSAVKFCQDIYNLKLLPLVTGVSISQFSSLECLILSSLQYILFVQESTFLEYSRNVSSFKLMNL